MSFWGPFLDTYWEKKPTVLRSPALPPIASSVDLFRVLLGAHARARSEEASQLIRFYIDGVLELDSFADHGPKESDQTVAGYAQRLSRELSGSKFGLIVNGYPNFDPVQLDRSREFVRGLYEHLGIPAGGVYVDTFLGNYEKTPFGVHKDSQSVFTWVIEGHKKFLLWPFEALSDYREDIGLRQDRSIYLDLLDYEEFREQAIVLEGDPGDVFYWPSSYWHVAESDGGFVATATIGVVVTLELREHLSELLHSLVGESRADFFPFKVDQLGTRAQPVPEAVTRLVRALRNEMAGPDFDRIVAAWYVDLLGRDAIHVPPPPRADARPLTKGSVVRGNPRYPIVWTQPDAESIIVSANGHALPMHAHPRVIELIKRLNTGVPVPVDGLLDDPQLKMLLEWCYEYRSLS